MATGIFLGSDGAVYHEMCWQPMRYRGVRGLSHADFECQTCRQHVTLSMTELSAVPLSPPPAGHRVDVDAALAAAGLSR